MKRIYLIRHSQPDFPEGKKMCIGSTDISLGTIGRIQSVILAEGLKDKSISAVYCSDLKRSIETAGYLTDAPVQNSDLREFDCGEWDGLTFDEIRERWPEIYRLRGEDLTYPIPGAENLEKAKTRFERGIRKAVLESEGDIALVGHATANKVFLCGFLGIDVKKYRTIEMDYASVTTLCYDGDFFIEKQNERMMPEMTEELCKKLLEAAGTPKHVQAHCFAVTEQAKKLCEELKEKGILLDKKLLIHGAMLHDIARIEKEHAKKGGELLAKAGYPMLGEVIRAHHNLDDAIEEIDERSVLILADCSVREAEAVSVEERFEYSRKKCKTDEAINRHKKKYDNAVKLKDKINQICGKEIIL